MAMKLITVLFGTLNMLLVAYILFTHIKLEHDLSIWTEPNKCNKINPDVLHSHDSKDFLASIAEKIKHESVPTSIYCSAKKKGDLNGLFLVPNIVHLIQFGKQEFTLLRYITLLSADKFLKPDLILFWGNWVPSDESIWWRRTVNKVKNMYHIHVDPPTHIIGRKVVFTAHSSDWLRIHIIKDFGGIYLDNDIIVLRSFDKLRNHSYVMGLERPDSMATGVILGRQNATFLHRWIASYKNYDPSSWGINSVKMAYKLAQKYPDDIHVEKGTFTNPNWLHDDLMYIGHYNYSENYSVHIYHEDMWYIPNTEEELAGYNCTLGDVMRLILYGNSTIRSANTWNGLKHNNASNGLTYSDRANLTP